MDTSTKLEPGACEEQEGPCTVKGCRESGDRWKQLEKWEPAIREYSKGLDLDGISPEDQHYLYSQRCEALAEMSKWLRSRPAQVSERNALYGVDPFHLANLAMQDAKRAIALHPRGIQGYKQLGNAHLMLEQYREAESAYLEGLGQDPMDEELQQKLRELKALTDTLTSRKVTARDDLECVLCVKLLFEPVTTPCGHSFCRACLRACLEHYNTSNNNNKCPMCRTVLHVTREIPVTVTLANIIEKSFPDEYAERRAEMQGENQERSNPPVPLFVMQCMLPGEKMALNIFEPRYRLMVRRCMEGSRRFGMAALVNQDLHPVACECEITDCVPQPDGRYYLEIVGRQRFRVRTCWEQDGYRIADPEYFSDIPETSGTPAAEEAQELARHVEGLADAWVRKVKSYAGRTMLVPQQLATVLDLVERAGEKPLVTDQERLSFWCANVVPLDMHERLQLLNITSSRARFELLLPAIEHRLNHVQCCIM